MCGLNIFDIFKVSETLYINCMSKCTGTLKVALVELISHCFFFLLQNQLRNVLMLISLVLMGGSGVAAFDWKQISVPVCLAEQLLCTVRGAC